MVVAGRVNTFLFIDCLRVKKSLVLGLTASVQNHGQKIILFSTEKYYGFGKYQYPFIVKSSDVFVLFSHRVSRHSPGYPGTH